VKAIHCAAVDLGATSGRVIVGTWSDRQLKLAEVHRFPNQFRSLGGHDYWDLPYLWAEISAGLLKAKEQFPDLASVGVDGWGVDHALVDARGRLVHPVYAYRDVRTKELSAQLEQKGLAEIYALTGLPNYPYNTSLQLQETLQAFPELGRAAARCLFISDYFNFLLSGRMENEFSICSHSQLLDVHGRGWSPAAFAAFGIPAHWFSAPAISPRSLGPVTGVPKLESVQAILVPGHDTACAFAAMPAAADGTDLYLSCGTWSLIGFESDQPVVGPEAFAASISNERTGDGRYRPLRACLGLWLLERTFLGFAGAPTDGPAWDQLIATAGRLPPPAMLLDLTDSSLFNPPDMRAAIDAQLRRLGAEPPSELPVYVRLITDSIGRAHADSMATFQRLTGRAFKRILIVGGGSKNRLLCQATADACGVPVVSFALEGSAVGNLASQLIALGAVTSLAAFRADLFDDLRGVNYYPR
jgi:rhamnulokinase